MIKPQDITGTWRMVARHVDPEDRAEMVARYSDSSDGLAVFAPDGWMSAIVCHAKRSKLPGEPAWQSDAPDDARLAAFDSYVSYAGRWRIEDGQLKTRVQYALNPNWIGGDQVRDVELLDDGILRLSVTRTWPNGKAVRVWIDWRRAD